MTRRSVHSITDAPVKHSAEQRGRMISYAIAMSTRVVCFVAAAIVAVVWETWWAMVLAGAAMVLPYVAVVAANAGGQRYMAPREAADQPQPLLSQSHEQPETDRRQWWEDSPPPEAASPAVIDGEVVPESEQGRQERRY